MVEYDYMIVQMPETTDFDQLLPQQQETIRDFLDARWIPNIMPGTQPVNGRKLVAAVVPRHTLEQMAPDEQTLQAMLSDPATLRAVMEQMAMDKYNLDWKLMYMRTVDPVDTGQVDQDGNPILAPHEFYPMDPAVKNFISPDLDENGNPIPPTFPKRMATFDCPGLRQFPVIVL